MSSDRLFVKRSYRIMATEVGIHVAVESGGEQRAEAAIEACAMWLREVEARLTRFTSDSELSALNAAGGSWQPVSEMLFTVVELSVAAAEASGGLFDPTILPVLEALGYDRDFKSFAYGDVEHAEASGSPPPATTGAWAEIELDRAGRRVRLPEGTRLDLGGIAKGWAADVAVERFFDDVPGILLNVGGDMRVRGGLRDGEPWALGIGDPRASAGTVPVPHVAVITMERGGLAASGATSRWWRLGGKRQHHVIDPRTGRPARLWIDSEDDTADGTDLIATATALAPTAAQAEVAAKVALLRGYPDALREVDTAWRLPGFQDAAAHGGRVSLLMVLGSGRVVCSENMREYLLTLGGGGDIWLD